jgi:tRNA (cytosine38-C5)-methyltransferase
MASDRGSELAVPEKVLSSSSGWCLDLRTPNSEYTACFTKSYSRFARGTGSVLVEPLRINNAHDGNSNGNDDEIASDEYHRLVAELESILVAPRLSHETTTTPPLPPTSSLTSSTTSTTTMTTAITGEPHHEEASNRAGWWTRVQARVPFSISIRYLSPSELLRLFGFPPTFTFPATLPQQKCYELIGNSINVTVVSRLLTHGLQMYINDL